MSMKDVILACYLFGLIINMKIDCYILSDFLNGKSSSAPVRFTAHWSKEQFIVQFFGG